MCAKIVYFLLLSCSTLYSMQHDENPVAQYSQMLTYIFPHDVSHALNITNTQGPIRIIGDPAATEIKVTINKQSFVKSDIELIDILNTCSPEHGIALSTNDNLQRHDAMQIMHSPIAGLTIIKNCLIQNYSLNTPSVAYEVTAPVNAKIIVQNKVGNVFIENMHNVITVITNGGDVVIEGSEAPITISTNTGQIVVYKASDTIRAVTMIGKIYMDACNGTIDAMTSTGNITIENAANRITVATGIGDVLIDNCTGSIIAFAQSGKINIQRVSSSVDAKTTVGEITVDDCAGTIDVSTECHGIHINNARSIVNAKSSMGPIEVRMPVFQATTPVTLSTVLGSIKLILPNDASGILNVSAERAESLNFENIAIDPMGQRVLCSPFGTGVGGNIKLSTHTGKIHVCTQLPLPEQ